jgi:hypothetical protein
MNAKPSFRPVPCHGGWQILVTWPDARTEQLRGYSSEAEAVKWINNLSDKWADKALAEKASRFEWKSIPSANCYPAYAVFR